MRSKVESAVYDFKQGLYSLNPKERKFEEKVFENKILKNIAALANLGKEKTGYLLGDILSLTVKRKRKNLSQDGGEYDEENHHQRERKQQQI